MIRFRLTTRFRLLVEFGISLGPPWHPWEGWASERRSPSPPSLAIGGVVGRAKQGCADVFYCAAWTPGEFEGRGDQGYKGYQGYQGYKGYKGYQGYQG